MRLSAPAIAVLASLASGAPPQAEETPSPCGPVEFGITTDRELVDRIGPPCWVHTTTTWDAFVAGKSQPTEHSLAYGRVCAVDCPDCPDPDTPRPPVSFQTNADGIIVVSGGLDDLICKGHGLCHSGSSEAALAGPFGPAAHVKFTVRKGRVIAVEWEYSGDDLPSARAALLRHKAFDVDSTSLLQADYSSPTCDVGVFERKEHSIWAMASKRGA